MPDDGATVLIGCPGGRAVEGDTCEIRSCYYRIEKLQITRELPPGGGIDTTDVDATAGTGVAAVVLN